MKKLFLCTALILTGCSIIGPTYTGETTADTILKWDTERNLGLFFRALHDCYPQKIHTKINNIPQPNSAEETWTLIGCGATESFNVKYIPDGIGGTYINFQKSTKLEK